MPTRSILRKKTTLTRNEKRRISNAILWAKAILTHAGFKYKTRTDTNFVGGTTEFENKTVYIHNIKQFQTRKQLAWTLLHEACHALQMTSSGYVQSSWTVSRNTMEGLDFRADYYAEIEADIFAMFSMFCFNIPLEGRFWKYYDPRDVVWYAEMTRLYSAEQAEEALKQEMRLWFNKYGIEAPMI